MNIIPKIEPEIVGRARAMLIAAILAALMISGCGTKEKEEPANADREHADKHSAERSGEISLSPEILEAAKLEFATVASHPAGGQLRVAGSVEIDQQRMQQATPLVSGRVEKVYVALGDRVQAGQPLSLISSPQIAQMHGKLHEAETKLGLAERELERVLRAENRVEVLKAKARLDQAEAALKRTNRLIELGAGAGKDLIAAEAEYKTAKAEYEFQRDISLNRQVAEAKAAVATAKVDVSHIHYEMKALGAPVVESEHDDHKHDTSLIILRSPVSGTVVERLVNPGAGIEAGRQLFTVANLSTVWVIANVPEAQVIRLRLRGVAQVFSAAFGDAPRSGRTGHVSYIDPQLNEETRTAKVRIELPNRDGLLKAGMFAEVEFQTGPVAAEKELVVPEAAIQRIGERTVVFVPEENEPGHFKVLDVEAGGAVNGLTRILSGLKEGDRIVAKGSFTLKTQLMKSELKEDDH
jgi:cobalt-zinc-cadmium efflux system membrane fusion protein